MTQQDLIRIRGGHHPTLSVHPPSLSVLKVAVLVAAAADVARGERQVARAEPPRQEVRAVERGRTIVLSTALFGRCRRRRLRRGRRC